MRKILIFSAVVFLMLIPVNAEKIVLNEYQYYKTRDVYRYYLDDIVNDVRIYYRTIYDTNSKSYEEEYISELGTTIKKWLEAGENFDNDKNDYVEYFRFIPFEYDDIFTIDGEKVIIDTIFMEGHDNYLFRTEYGIEVEPFWEYGVNGNYYYKFKTINSLLPTYNITFNANKGVGNINSINIPSLEEIILPECTFTREGYKFSYWYDGYHDYNPKDTYIVPNKDITFIAIWEEDMNEPKPPKPPVPPINPENPSTPSTPKQPPFVPIILQPILPSQPSQTDVINEPTTTENSTEWVNPYKDISNHWGYEYIELMAKLGLMDGITSTEFKPDEPMTRETFLIAMARLADVEDNYIEWAIENGILIGYGNGEYGLNDTITREQMAVIFNRYFNLLGIELPIVNENITPFTDNESISEWAKESIILMQQTGLIQGKGNNIFDPQGLSTRAEGSTVLYNLIQIILKNIN